MKFRLGNTLALAILIIAGGWGAIYFLNNYERVSREIDMGPTGEARTNELLAVSRIFNKLGLPSKTFALLPGTPPAGATLILPGARQEMSTADSESLLRWVRAGGHLVVVAQHATEQIDDEEEEPDDQPSRDVLLDPLGVRKIESKADEPQRREWRTKPRTLDLFGESIQARFPQTYHLQDRYGHALWAAPQTHPQLLQYAVGKGRITALTDHRFLTNRQIKEHDHAILAWLLTQPQTSKDVWLVYEASMPSLLVWLWQRAAELIIALTLTLLTWLWWRGSRLGPRLPDPTPRRRRLLDHIDASGRFLWRHGERKALLTAVREATFRLLEFRHPAWAQLPSDKLYQNLAELTGLSQHDIRAAWLLDEAESPHEFTHCVHVFELIRKKL